MNFFGDNSDDGHSDDWDAAAAAAAVDNKFSQHLEDGAVVLSIEDVSYDRDMKFVNVPMGERRSGAKIRPSHGMVKQINSITGKKDELNTLDEHYRGLDKRKSEHDATAGGSSRRRPEGKKKGGRAPKAERDTEKNANSVNPRQKGRTSGQVVLLSRPTVTNEPKVSLRPDAPAFVPSWEK